MYRRGVCVCVHVVYVPRPNMSDSKPHTSRPNATAAVAVPLRMSTSIIQPFYACDNVALTWLDDPHRTKYVYIIPRPISGRYTFITYMIWNKCCLTIFVCVPTSIYIVYITFIWEIYNSGVSNCALIAIARISAIRLSNLETCAMTSSPLVTTKQNNQCIVSWQHTVLGLFCCINCWRNHIFFSLYNVRVRPCWYS